MQVGARAVSPRIAHVDRALAPYAVRLSRLRRGETERVPSDGLGSRHEVVVTRRAAGLALRATQDSPCERRLGVQSSRDAPRIGLGIGGDADQRLEAEGGRARPEEAPRVARPAAPPQP
jgi:hypothetical protein